MTNRFGWTDTIDKDWPHDMAGRMGNAVTMMAEHVSHGRTKCPIVGKSVCEQ